mmetsp:Transcript_88556/g.170463  ORF Transcript_88556/g.170463 Transcript_88556/m.170463 type:complete len:229 (+) Transcript_88556:1-687(+)
MKDTLFKATEDASLVVAMQTDLVEQTAKTAADNQPIPADELVKQVRETFSATECDGTLGAALERAIVGDEDVGVAEVNGAAREAVQVSCKDVVEAEETPEVAQDTAEHTAAMGQFGGKTALVLNAAMNAGTLGSTVEAVIAKRPNGTDVQQDPFDPKPQDLLMRMKGTLLQATCNGSLQIAIEKALQDTKEAELRAEVKHVLAHTARARTVECALKGAREHGSSGFSS